MWKKHIGNGLITVAALGCAFGLSLLFQYTFQVQEHITTVFVFAVFLTALLTQGYFYGVAAAIVGTVAVNYAFTFPFFSIDFTTPVNIISGIVMVAIAVLTSALLTKLKQQEAVKTEIEKERMRANLLRAVSHDLRTPLTTIYASGTTLLESGDALTETQKRRLTAGIKEDAEWLIRMVENLLSVTRIDSGQVQLLKTPTVLDELVDAVLLKFRKRYPGQPVRVELPEEVVVIPMDALLIEQVLINLLENAVQHAKGMTRLAFRVYTCGAQAVFEVADNGCGIPPKRLETVFSGYQTGETGVADSHKRNAGIGLSVCAAIVRAHGGNITAQNSETGGAVIRFALDTEEINDDTE